MFTKKPQMTAMGDGSLLIETFGSTDVNCYACHKRKERAAETLTQGSFAFALHQAVRSVSVFQMRNLKLHFYFHRIKLVSIKLIKLLVLTK